uniref:BRCT domain-containing protein n=1 Tax=Caenorhabditis tropicalis TaxID=1561998 RepID=A0A1I7SYX5_9PELO
MGEVKACDPEVVQMTKNVFDALKRNALSDDEIINKLISKTSELTECMNNFQDYSRKVKNVFNDHIRLIRSLQNARKSSEEFQKTSINFTNVPNEISTVEDIFQLTQETMKGFENGGVGEMFKRGIEPLEIIFNPKKTVSQLWTSGFQSIEDLIKVPKDLKSEWFKKKISRGKSVEELEKSLESFYKFGEMMMKLEKSWLKFGKMFISSKNHLNITTTKLIVSESSIRMNPSYFKEYKQKFIKCNVTDDFNKTDYKDFDELWGVISQINSKIEKIFNWCEKIISEIDPDPLNNFLDSLKNMGNSKERSLTKIKELKRYETFYKFSEQFEELYRDQEDIKVIFSVDTIKKQRGNMNNILKLFEKSAIFKLSLCLAKESFDSKPMKSAIEYITSTFDVSHSKPTRELFNQFLIMRSDLSKVEEFIKGSKANFSENNIILKLETAKEISLNFGRGVNLIHGMAIAFQNKNSLREATNYDKEVLESIQKSIKNNRHFWENPVKPINKLLMELENLNRFAGNITDNDLLEMKEIFQKAKKLEGFPDVFTFHGSCRWKNGLLDAVREINAPNVLKAVKNGSFINAYTKLGNTALHVATKRAYPDIVNILIKNGADRTLLNIENKTPEQLIPPNYRETHKEKIERFEKVEKIYKKYEKKKFRIQIPDVFPNSSFHIYVEGRTNDSLTNSFTDKFQAITSDEMLSTTTHCIVKTEKGGYLETDDIKLLLWVFSGVIIVKDTWMIDCLKDEKKIDRDSDYLVENIKYNGIMYNTVIQWTTAMAKSTIPFLHGIHVAVVILDYEHIVTLSNIVTTHGGVMLDKFPEKYSYNLGSCPYLHANQPPLFIIHDGKVDLDIYRNDTDKMYSFFTEKEFLGFMLKREIQVNPNPNPIPVSIDEAND